MSGMDKLIEAVEAGVDLPEIGHGYWQFLPAGACILAARTYHDGSLDDHELSRIEAYFNGQDFRDICLWAGLRCDPAAAIAYATGQWSERVAA